MEIDEEEFSAIVELLRIHASALTKLVNDNEKMKEQIGELYIDRIKDKLIAKAAIMSIINSLNNKRIMDSQQFLALFRNQITEDKSIFDAIGINIEEILNGDGTMKPSPESQYRDESKPVKKHKVKIKNGIIDFQDYKKDC